MVIKILQHLRTCPELLKSCICDPEIRGGAIYYNAKGQTLRQVNRVSVPPWFLDHRYSIRGSVQSFSNPVSVIQKLGGGAIYCNAKGQTLRQVKERRWPLLIVVKKSYKLQVTRKGKATIRVRVPPPRFLDHRYSIWGSVQSSSNPVSVIQKLGGGGIYYNAKGQTGLVTSLVDCQIHNLCTSVELTQIGIWIWGFRGGGSAWLD